MKRFLISFLLILPIFLSACAKESNNIVADEPIIYNIDTEKFLWIFDELLNEDNDFRNAKWGMSMHQVMTSENSTKNLEVKEQSKTWVSYKIDVEFVEIVLSYSFIDGELWSGYFGFSDDFITNVVDYYQKYNQIIENFTNIYGKPTENKIFYEDDLYKENEPTDWNKAIINNNLWCRSSWELKNDKISIQIYNPRRGKHSKTQEDYITIEVNVRRIIPETTTVPQKQAPKIGMTKKEAENSTWGKPQKINRTTTVYGVSEQWVYSNYRYLYFDDGILTAIQD